MATTAAMNTNEQESKQEAINFFGYIPKLLHWAQLCHVEDLFLSFNEPPH